MDKIENIGDAIRHHRTRRGMSQTDLATAAEVSMNYVCQIEKGRKFPSLQTLSRLARALDIDTSELVKETDPVVRSLRSLLDDFGEDRVLECLSSLRTNKHR